MISKIGKKRTSIITAKSCSWIDSFDASEAAERIGEELQRHKIRKPALLIGVSRAQVDACQVILPPASEAEIPQIVQNEVRRQFGECPENAAIDFTISENEGQRVAEAFILRADAAKNIEAFTGALQLDANAIMLRHYSVASLFRRLVSDDNTSLLVNLLSGSADLLVVRGQSILATRTILAGVDTDTIQVQRLANEIQRTIVANPLTTDTANIYVFGRTATVKDLAETLASQLPYAVRVLDPLEGMEHSGIRGDDPTFPMAALTSMIRDFQDRSIPVDFAHPKQPPKKPSRVRKAVFYVAAAVAVVAILGYRFYSDLTQLDRENQVLQAELEKNEQLLEKLQSKTAIVDNVERWEQMSLTWLDEIRDFSLRFPEQGKGIVDRLSCNMGTGSTGVMTMGVRVSEPAIVDELEEALRDSYRRVRSKRISQSDPSQDFPCQFETTIVLQPRPRESYYASEREPISTAFDHDAGDLDELKRGRQ